MLSDHLDALCTQIPALHPDIAADVISALLVTAPRPKDQPDPEEHDRTLVRSLAEYEPRDLEEATLARQIIVANAVADLCGQAAYTLDPLSKDASRLRRDAALQCRLAATLLRTLNRIRTRPMRTNPVTGEHRPTVLTTDETATTRRRQPEPEPETPPKPFPPPDVFDGHPDLKALNDRWYSLPRWEDMTKEERLETWGYKHEPGFREKYGKPQDPADSQER